MILRNNTKLTIKDVEQGLLAALALLDSGWLAAQHRLEPTDPLLAHLKPNRSPRQLIHGVRHGIDSDQMHPLAEAVVLGREILAHYEKHKEELGSNFLYYLISLRDVHFARGKIKNIENRIPELQKEDWKSALYELLIAAAYSESIETEVLPVTTLPTPDLLIHSNPISYIECKMKKRYDEQVVAFVSTWRQSALGKIAGYLSNVDAGFLVKIIVNQSCTIATLPDVIKSMVTKGERSGTISGAQISIEPFEASEATPPASMPLMSEDFWKWALDFDEWDEWHYVLPGGHFQFHNLSNCIVKSVKRPVLICVRAEHLADNTQNIYNALDYACDKQLKLHRPGIIHVLINANLFGLGAKGREDYIVSSLTKLTDTLFRQYSRVWKVSYDIVIPPKLGKYAASVIRVARTNPRCSPTPDPSSYMEPPRILLW